MKQQLFPLTLVSWAAIAVPFNAVAVDHPLQFDLASNPVVSDANTAGAIAVGQAKVEIAPSPSLASEPIVTAISQADIPVRQPEEATASQTRIVLNFEPPATAIAAPVDASAKPDSVSPVQAEPATKPAPASALPSAPNCPPAKDLFAGGSESLVARTVGAAEGTRSADGGKTDNYHGHVDPGNGVWNRGTFSYQFGNEENLTPDEADRRQLAKIKRIYEAILLTKADQQGLLPLTLAEALNGIDLINQAPLAVTEAGGYIERLAEAKRQKGVSGDEAILKARIWAFWDPQKNGWDAPGLRAYDDLGKEESTRRDQDRRMGMINQALDFYEQQHGAIAAGDGRSPQKVAAAPTLSNTHSTAINSTATNSSVVDRVVDLIIYQRQS